MGVMIGVVGRMVVNVLLLLLLPGARKGLQEDVLWGNRAECDETSSGAEGEDADKGSGIMADILQNLRNHVRRYMSCEFTVQIQRCA